MIRFRVPEMAAAAGQLSSHRGQKLPLKRRPMQSDGKTVAEPQDPEALRLFDTQEDLGAIVMGQLKIHAAPTCKRRFSELVMVRRQGAP